MGILRKLAGLVVEFPDDDAAGTADKPHGSVAAGGDDVLASIEKARQELEGHVAQRKAGSPLADPLDGATIKPAANPFTSEAGGGAPPTTTAAGSTIPLPTLLTVDQIYERAGLSADPQQMNVYRVQQMLADPDMADLDVSIRARTVKMTLKNMGHDLHEIIVDAAKRDSAIDSYSQWLTVQVENVGQQVEAENAKLKQEIEAFIAERNAQIEANRQALETAKQSQESFAKTKQTEEQRLFDTVAPFVAPGENPVVVGGSAPQRKGDTL